MSRILVADDAPALRVLLRRCLEIGGHEAVMAIDGAEAIRLLRTTADLIDAIVTDHAMPGASGLEVITAAQLVDPGIPCIIVTAHDDLDLASMALSAGAVAFIPKPFKPQHLLTVLDRALERRRRVADGLAVAAVVGPARGRGAGEQEWVTALAGRTAERLGLGDVAAGHARIAAAMRTAAGPTLPAVARDLLSGLAGAARLVDGNRARATATLFDGVAELAPVRSALLHQGERWDGGGQIDAMSGEDIPILARIVAAVDLAATSTDAGRNVAVDLGAAAGRALDPAVVRAMQAVLARDPLVAAHTAREQASGARGA